MLCEWSFSFGEERQTVDHGLVMLKPDALGTDILIFVGIVSHVH